MQTLGRSKKEREAKEEAAIPTGMPKQNLVSGTLCCFKVGHCNHTCDPVEPLSLPNCQAGNEEQSLSRYSGVLVLHLCDLHAPFFMNSTKVCRLVHISVMFAVI